jgi:hypothetical protein
MEGEREGGREGGRKGGRAPSGMERKEGEGGERQEDEGTPCAEKGKY